MQKFQLELLFQIIGIGSASGLLFKNDSLFLVSDNSKALYEYSMTDKKLEAHLLIENTELPKDNIPKNVKPDFECITSYGEDLCVFGSGSTENRNQMVQFNTYKKQPVKTLNLSDLYASMQSFGNIHPGDFNIEGAVYTGEKWFLFQRGNGQKSKNGVFTVEAENLSNEFSILFNSFRLPKIKGIQASFTDAVLVGNSIYFLASAENTNSTYNDGEVLGSLIGSIDIETMRIGFTQQISETHKFEGLTLYKNEKDNVQFLLCEDNDSDLLQSNIYKLTLQK